MNSPNNPSGQVCDRLEEISDIAKKYNLIILSDEIYSELTFKENYKSISNFCPEKTIISTGLSKWCGAGGWRLGYFIIPDELKDIKNTINENFKEKKRGAIKIGATQKKVLFGKGSKKGKKYTGTSEI